MLNNLDIHLTPCERMAEIRRLVRESAAAAIDAERAESIADSIKIWRPDELEDLWRIRQWHVEDNHWRDIGYHWLIGRAGEILAGRPETEIGAGVEGHNRGVIHICLIGGFGSTEHDAFAANFTPAQAARLRAQIQAISMRTQITRISGHNEWAAKACPGFNVPAWLKGA